MLYDLKIKKGHDLQLLKLAREESDLNINYLMLAKAANMRKNTLTSSITQAPHREPLKFHGAVLP